MAVGAMDTDAEIEMEVRIRKEIEALVGEIDEDWEGTAPPESLDGMIGPLSRKDSLMEQEMANDAQRRRSLR
jgi:hypothetical protein